jgi:hypothetical protein
VDVWEDGPVEVRVGRRTNVLVGLWMLGCVGGRGGWEGAWERERFMVCVHVCALI